MKIIGNEAWNGSKFSKNATLGRFGGILASTRWQDRKEASARLRIMLIYVKKARFWAPFWNPLDFEGVPKSHFFNINQHKMKKNEVLEGVLEKHVFLIRNRCGKVTFREA